eukprot:6502577-Karenia_brevis.AAC.1
MLQITMLAEAEADVERRKAKRSPFDQLAGAADSVGAAEGTVDGESEQAAAAAESPPAGDEGVQLVPPGVQTYDPKTDLYLKK